MITNRATRATVEHAPVIGGAIGRYRLLGLMDEGRSGPLYIAEQQGIRDAATTVALRVIRPELARSPWLRERFFEVASVVSRREHPSIVHVFEMGEVDGCCFVCMEYLAGESLASILARAKSRVAPDIAAHLVKRVASALRYVRELRAASPCRPSGHWADVDTSNVFVTRHGAVKWLGVSSLANMPSIANMPVPSATDDDAERGADVFNLGVLLWTCLVGEYPFLAASRARAGVPDALAAIAMRAVANDRRERFQDVHALSDALDGYLFRRDCRPTPEHIRRWMEQLFDAERASLQAQIARGHDVAGALSLLQRSKRGDGGSARPRSRPSPRPLWLTSQSLPSRPTRLSVVPALERSAPSTSTALPSQAARPRRTGLVAVLIVAMAVAGGAVLMLSTDGGAAVEDAARRAQWTDRSGRVDVRSTPPGAAVFVDGEPTGLRTPVVLRGLSAGRSIHLRVEKAGFVGQQRQVEVPSGSLEMPVFELAASDGLAVFAGAPANARLYVDDHEVAVADEQPVLLAVGPHAVRLETSGTLIFSDRVVIVAGEQTIHVEPNRGAP